MGSILTRVYFGYIAHLFSPEFPKQFKWHQQSPRDPEGWWGAEWKLPPLVSERERKSPPPVSQCWARQEVTCGRLLSPQYSPTMTMSVWPPLPSPQLSLFAIIPRIWTQYRTRPNTSAPNQGWLPFWFARTPTGAKNPSGWRLPLLAQNEGQFLHRSVPSVTKPATENAFILCPLQSLPSPTYPLDPRAQKKVEVYLSYFWIFALWPRKMSRLPPLKTLESAYMHRGLGRRGRFTSRRPVTHAAWRRTPLPMTPFSPTLILLFKEVFKGKRLLFRRGFTVT